MEESNAKGASPGVLREVNRSLVLDAIKAGGQISRARVAEQVGLTKPTVSAIVDTLLHDGVIRELGPGATARRRLMRVMPWLYGSSRMPVASRGSRLPGW